MKQNTLVNTGWIYPDLTVHYLHKIYRHFTELFSDPEALKFLQFKTVEEMKAWAQEQYEDAEAAFIEQLDPGEHPGWHNFYGYTNHFIESSIWESGFIRFGTLIDDYDCTCAETSSEKILTKDVANSIMDKLGVDKLYSHSVKSYVKQKVFKRIK